MAKSRKDSRKSRKGSRKSRKSSRKSRKGSRKSRKGSRKSRKGSRKSRSRKFGADISGCSLCHKPFKTVSNYKTYYTCTKCTNLVCTNCMLNLPVRITNDGFEEPVCPCGGLINDEKRISVN
jgi:hypothetical protein